MGHGWWDMGTFLHVPSVFHPCRLFRRSQVIWGLQLNKIRREYSMGEIGYIKTGTASGQEPAFSPVARAVFMVLEENKDHEMTDDDFMAINLHAQKELRAESSEFGKAQDCWSNLPKTPERQLKTPLSGRYSPVPKIEEDTVAQEWITEFRDYDGLVYIFSVTRKIDLRTGETFKPIPVVGFSFSGGFDFMDDIGRKDCVRYRMYYAYAEKP